MSKELDQIKVLDRLYPDQDIEKRTQWVEEALDHLQEEFYTDEKITKNEKMKIIELVNKVNNQNKSNPIRLVNKVKELNPESKEIVLTMLRKAELTKAIEEDGESAFK